jgi:iduronate 2-sulfatase
MNRRTFLAASAAPLLSAAPRRPNILFLAADDMNTSLGCYGHKHVRTPNIDRLASGGVLFERAYCQFPLCGPSRASLLTGMRPDRTQVLGNNVDFRQFHAAAVTLPQLFKNNGWYSAREGKMFHMNVPGEVGSPKYQDEASWHHSVSPPGLEMKSQGEGGRLSAPGNSFGMNWIRTADSRGQADDNAAEHAIALLEQHRNEPFFLGVGFIRPHLPFVAPSKYYDLYPLENIPLARNPSDDLADIPALARNVRPMLWNHLGMDETRQRMARRGYYASTSFMDAQAGRVLDALDKLGLAANTIVVFWGDHGWDLGEHTRWQKMSLMEGSTRVPLIIRHPGARGNGRLARGLVEFIDIYPTLAGLCGIEPPGAIEGRSLAPLLQDPSRPFKQAAFSQLKYESIEGRAVRTDRYRYIHWKDLASGETDEELYDHTRDPGEFTNLARLPGHETVAQRHRALLGGGAVL